MITNIPKLNKELAALRLEKDETAKLMSSRNDELTKLQEQVKSLTDEKTQLQNKLTEFKKEEAAVVVAVSETVNEKVVQKLAAMGVPEGTVAEKVETPAASNDPLEVYKKYESLAGKDKIDFFKKNEKAIMSQMKSLHYQPFKSKDGVVNLTRF